MRKRKHVSFQDVPVDGTRKEPDQNEDDQFKSIWLAKSKQRKPMKTAVFFFNSEDNNRCRFCSQEEHFPVQKSD